MNSGGALGKGVGPLLIAAAPLNITDLNNKKIGIPGENTTAHMLFSLAFPGAANKVFKVFNEIEDAVLRNGVTAGVIIHENRFTYQLKGLHKLMDLGEYWEQTTGLPIPLGGIVAKRGIDKSIIKAVDDLIKQSVEYAYQHHYDELADYVKEHAQEMNETVMRQHINLYVNNYSAELGEAGKTAVLKLLEVYQQLHPEVNISSEEVFVE